MSREDKRVEHDRYDKRALSLINEDLPITNVIDIPLRFRAPYCFYEEQINKFSLGAGSSILEIGAGTGALTTILL